MTKRKLKRLYADGATILMRTVSLAPAFVEPKTPEARTLRAIASHLSKSLPIVRVCIPEHHRFVDFPAVQAHRTLLEVAAGCPNSMLKSDIVSAAEFCDRVANLF